MCFVLEEIFDQQSPTVQTNPTLSNRTIATGYVGLQLSVQVQRGMYHACLWRYGNLLADIFTSSIPCNNNDGEGYELNCTNSNNLITSTLTILLATSESLTARVDCQKSPVESAITVTSLNLTVSGEGFALH